MRPSSRPSALPAVPRRAVALSLGLHAALVAAVWLVPGPKRIAPEPPAISMRVVAVPARDARPEPAPVSPAEPVQPPLPRPADRPPEPVAAVDDAEPPPAGHADPGEEDVPVAPFRPGIRGRILDQIAGRDVVASEDGEALPWTSSGEAVPGLPGYRGWLSGHVGRVEPGGQRWRANDGSSRARYVLADGTTVCTQRRAPTIDEIMNPWKSTAVTMATVCGRERPPRPDFGDPRIRPPPAGRSRDDPAGER